MSQSECADNRGKGPFGTDLSDPVLVTGAAGFIGSRLVDALLRLGFSDVRCFLRPSSDLGRIAGGVGSGKVKVITGNLLSRPDCERAAAGVKVIYHLAAGTGTKSFADAYLNSVVTTRNLLEAAVNAKVRRFVSLSSFSVYTNLNGNRLVDENSAIEKSPESRSDAYCYAKVKQDAIVEEYGKTRGLSYVLIRPGVVYGPGKAAITGRVGIAPFGVFFHLGGGNQIPFTYVDNCADAIALAGLAPGLEGEVFNVVDDDLPTSRDFLRQYRKQVLKFRAIHIPHWASYFLCWFWEMMANGSKGQLPAVYTRREWAAYWKRCTYSNTKLKTRLGWQPRISTNEGLKAFFESCRKAKMHA